MNIIVFPGHIFLSKSTEKHTKMHKITNYLNLKSPTH